ncbi:MAG: ATP-binding cassette domain-containing protein [Azospirillaceae bacterium]
MQVEGLVKLFAVRRGLLEAFSRPRTFVHAVNGVDFTIARREKFGLVGESGSGKSTTGKLVARLLEPTGGSVRLDGEDWLTISGSALRRRRRDVQVIFQNPFLSLNPRWSVESIVAEPLATHQVLPRHEVRDRVVTLLREVGLDPRQMRRYPHQFSGGQRQRIAIARALALNPMLLVADEPVSALDVSVQAQILNLLARVGAEHDLGMLFISHDMSVVRHLCDRVGVMYLGRLVEVAETRAIFREPRHPYTRSLLAAVPVPGKRQRFEPLQGEIPSPLAPPSGCVFHTRCPIATERCRVEVPLSREVAGGHRVACHHA